MLFHEQIFKILDKLLNLAIISVYPYNNSIKRFKVWRLFLKKGKWLNFT